MSGLSWLILAILSLLVRFLAAIAFVAQVIVEGIWLLTYRIYWGRWPD